MVKQYNLAFFVLFILLSSHSAFAVGSLVKDDTVEISHGSAKFYILFWGDGEKIKLWVERAPPRWAISINPEEFIADGISGDEYVKTAESYIKAKMVEVSVIPYENQTDYIIIGARATKEVGDAVSVFGDVYYNLSVIKSLKPEKRPEETPSQTTDLPWISYFFIIISVIAVSAIIYKHS